MGKIIYKSLRYAHGSAGPSTAVARRRARYCHRHPHATPQPFVNAPVAWAKFSYEAAEVMTRMMLTRVDVAEWLLHEATVMMSSSVELTGIVSACVILCDDYGNNLLQAQYGQEKVSMGKREF